MDGAGRNNIRNSIQVYHDIQSVDNAVREPVKATEEDILDWRQDRDHVAPIRFLPSELLVKIWSYEGDTIPLVILASWVVSRWRTIALDTPLLWCDILISPERSVDLVKTQLERSKSCPLAIMVMFNHGVFESFDSISHIRDRMSCLVTIVSAHIDRWRLLRMEGHYGTHVFDDWYMTRALNPLADTPAPQLRHLEICWFNGSKHMTYSPPLFMGITPLLSHVALEGNKTRSSLVLLSGLTSLSLRNITWPGHPTHTEFHTLLAASPRLVHLTLDTRSISYHSPIDHDRDHYSTIHVPSLRSLVLDLHDMVHHFIPNFFRTFSAPGLDSLTIPSIKSFSLKELINVLSIPAVSSNYHTLSKLSLPGRYMLHLLLHVKGDDNDIIRLAHSFPSISCLEFTNFHQIKDDAIQWDFFLKYFIDRDDSMYNAASEIYWPNLRTLIWPSCSPSCMNVSVLRRFVTRRISLGIPLITLFTYFTDFGKFDVVEQKWFREHVDVQFL